MQLIKCTLIFFLMSNLGFGQYSDYYKNFSGDLKKNPDNNMSINDIDLQELVEKNIKLELNRIPNTNFAFNRDRVFASQIANRPELAYNYGVDKMFFWGKEDRKKYKTGRKWNIYFKKPHYFIFDLISANKLFNTSSTGISTTITIFGSVPRKPELGFFTNNINKPIRDILDFDHLDIGELQIINGEEKFLHSKFLRTSIVFGKKGFVSTLISEDDLEKSITEIYLSSGDDNRLLFVEVVYSCGASIGFEELEGRKAYLNPLIEKVIASSKQQTNISTSGGG